MIRAAKLVSKGKAAEPPTIPPTPITSSSPPSLPPMDALTEFVRLKLINAYMEGVSRGALFVIETERFPDLEEKSEIRLEFEKRI